MTDESSYDTKSWCLFFIIPTGVIYDGTSNGPMGAGPSPTSLFLSQSCGGVLQPIHSSSSSNSSFNCNPSSLVSRDYHPSRPTRRHPAETNFDFAPSDDGCLPHGLLPSSAMTVDHARNARLRTDFPYHHIHHQPPGTKDGVAANSPSNASGAIIAEAYRAITDPYGLQTVEPYNSGPTYRGFVPRHQLKTEMLG